MNMSGLLEKGFAVLDNACWAGSSGVLRRRVFEAIQEKPQAPETSPYRKTIQDETVIEDFETDLHIKINNPNSKTVYSRKPMCALINPDNWGDVEIQRERWSNGPYILLKKLLKAGRHLSNKMFMIRAYRYLSYSVNMIVTLGILFKAASFAGNPFTYLYLLAGFLSYFRPLQKRGFSFKDSQLEIICNLFLLPTYLKGHISTIRQMITGKKIPFARTPKDGSRSRISLATAAFVIGSFGYLIGGVGPDLFQLVVNGKLTVNAMQLYTTALMGAAIFKFIGYQTLFKDFAFQVREKYRRLVSS
jgi:cellulose synthase/poly-beta-1,6-N-acetylglucosamine synthase-like glycosyltransferase